MRNDTKYKQIVECSMPKTLTKPNLMNMQFFSSVFKYRRELM